MKKPVNQILKEQFLKDFRNNRKQAEMESKQNPFYNMILEYSLVTVTNGLCAN